VAGRPIRINSAGIGEHEWGAPIIFAGVQSVWRSAARLGPRHLVLIDEAHLVPHDGDGMYRTLLAELRALAPADDMRIAGFSATPFRLDSGRLDEGEERNASRRFDYGVGQGSGVGCPADVERPNRSASAVTPQRRFHRRAQARRRRCLSPAACDEIVARGAGAHGGSSAAASPTRITSTGRSVRGFVPGNRRDAAPERADNIAAFKTGGSLPGQHQRF
jgi:DNA repair protein RadD